MLKASAVRTESEPRSLHRKRLLACFVFIVLLLAIAGVIAEKRADLLVLGNRKFTFETAQTETAQERGLSGRPSLAANHAVLFVFDKPGINCFWMKDMRFGLDIIWLDVGKRVVYIKQNAQPSTYPTSFCPDKPSQYTIEVNDGTVQKTGLKISDKVSF